MAQILENGPFPVDPKSRLWRYVSFPTLLFYLKGKLRLSSIDALKKMDPLEGCALWNKETQGEAFTSDENNQLFAYVRARKSPILTFSPLAQILSADSLRAYAEWHKIVCSTRYVLCFFESEHESMAMWRLYAPFGVAVRSSLEAFNSALATNGTERKWRISKMHYCSKTDEISADQAANDPNVREFLRRPFLLKGKEYEYENEVRLVTVDPGAKDRLVVPKVKAEEWMKEILLSPDLSKDDAEILREIIVTICPALEDLVSQSKTLEGVRWPGGVEFFLANDEEKRNREEAKHWPAFLHEP
jgi:hypothetical protein